MTTIKPSEMTNLQKQSHDNSIKQYNRGLNQGKGLKQSLGKDSFLQILVEQLKNQDPLKPQDDKEFIAQMAQFNSLEQMIDLNKGFQQLYHSIGKGQAVDLIGKEVTINSGLDHEGSPILVSGIVQSVQPSDSKQPALITINNQQFDSSLVIKVTQSQEKPEKV